MMFCNCMTFHILSYFLKYINNKIPIKMSIITINSNTINQYILTYSCKDILKHITKYIINFKCILAYILKCIS